MKLIKIALYKNSKTFFGQLIRLKQIYYPGRYSRYSHAEIVFEDGRSFSSSEVDRGVRFARINFKKENWDFIEINISPRKYKKILNFCENKTGNGYNRFGIFLAQFLNLNFKGNDDRFCSEIVTRALKEIKILCVGSSLFVCPARLAQTLEEELYFIKQ